MKNIKYPSCSFEGRYTYDVHENCLNFKTYPLFIYQRPKSFHPRDLGRPILNEPPSPFLPSSHPLQHTMEQQPHRACELTKSKQN